MRDYIGPDLIYIVGNLRGPCEGIVLRKAERVRPVNRPTTAKLHRELKDTNHDTMQALQRSSRFRAHDETDDSGHSYRTARYSTRFD